MFSLKNKIVLISGGSRGIGAACVELFCKAEANVVFTYNKDINAAKNLVNKISFNKPSFVKLNLESENEIINTAKKIINKFGRIDILINNAGIWKYAEADKMSLKDWNETIKINLTGTFLLTREIIPSMKKNKFGKIINISSTAGQRGESFHSHYAASKGAIIAFTKSLAGELAAFNINTNCIAPGWVETDMTIDEIKNEKKKKVILSAIPANRIAQPIDIAGPTLFLASEFANHINGEILNVNGGSVLCG